MFYQKMTSACLNEASSDPYTVERQLFEVCNQLNVTEVNIGLFKRMIKSGVATNDVRNFAHKQQNLNRQASRTAAVLSRIAMKQKLKDAFSTADGLRRKKENVEGITFIRAQVF